MKNLQEFETKSQFDTARGGGKLSKPYAVFTEDDKSVHVYQKPLLEIKMNNEYDDLALIPLKGIYEPTIWSHNLASDVATIDGTTLRFLKHYEGDVKITATAGVYSAEKTVTIKCTAVPDQVTYTVVTPPSVQTVNWDDTTAELSFVGKIVASYSDGHKPSEETQSTYHFTAEFPQNPTVYPAVNTEYVDLGLPSALKWAKCNLYAQSETEYGYYFQWGDTAGYPSAVEETTIDRTGNYVWEGNDVAWTVKQRNQNMEFTWEYYKHCEGHQYDLTKYNTSTSSGKNPDNKTVLEAIDDAATQIMGADWRMPNREDVIEMWDGTTHEFVEDYNGSGTNGYLLTSKTNGNTLFIPAAGYVNIRDIRDAGTYGNVWSSSLFGYIPREGVYFGWTSAGATTNNDNRCNGRSVRGVRK